MRLLAALLLLASWGCQQHSISGDAPSAKDAPAADAGPVAPTTGAGAAPSQSAAASVGAAFTPTRLAMGASVDVPQGFAVADDSDTSALFLGPQGARLVLLADGECGLGERVLCHPTNDDEKKWARTATKTSCMITGVRDDTIVWERRRVVDRVVYTVRLEYPKKSKDAYDAIVTRVSKTWDVPEKMHGGFYCEPPGGRGPGHP